VLAVLEKIGKERNGRGVDDLAGLGGQSLSESLAESRWRPRKARSGHVAHTRKQPSRRPTDHPKSNRASPSSFRTNRSQCPTPHEGMQSSTEYIAYVVQKF
jgi:hypothetical protein